jgi:hypothetical protein
MEGHMAKIDDFYPSKFLKAADLDGEDVHVTINEVGQDTFKEEDGTQRLKPILYFREKEKPLILNKTNFTRIAESAGPDTDSWHGSALVLFPDKVSMRGKSIDTVKVRPAPKPKAKAEFNDSVPF